jgi:hypothetical protein
VLHRPAPSLKTPAPIQRLEILKMANRKVKVSSVPAFDYNYDIMKLGVIQHIDRKYTYDVIPSELEGGLLFQGIHRPLKGTIIEFELLSPATVYFFFHDTVDGGYSKIFKNLNGWKRSKFFPQYDIHNGDHGLKMVMYQLDADIGKYSIPATTKDNGCFNLVFKDKL